MKATRGKKKTVNYKDDDLESDELSIEEEEEDIEKKRVLSNKRKRDEDEDEDEEDSDEEYDEDAISGEDDDEDDILSEDKEDEDEEGKKKTTKTKKVKDTHTPKEKKEKTAKPKAEKKEKKEKVVKPKKEKVVKPKKEKVAKVPKPKVPKPKKEILDSSFILEQRYFYQDIIDDDWLAIKDFINNFFAEGKADVQSVKLFFDKHPNLKKGDHNMTKLKQTLDEIAESIRSSISTTKFDCYKALNDYIVSEFYSYKPTVLETYFFPSKDNEVFVVNMLRTCKKTLDIAIFTLTNNKIAAAIEEAFNRGVDVRIIADDECCKMLGSDVFRLASIGVKVKTDNEAKYHMHHKFAVLDHSVVVTGSFNWTAQAVDHNQENILFYENKEIAKQYTNEYNKLWDQFIITIDKETGLKLINEENEKRKQWAEKRKLEKELKKAADAVAKTTV